MVYTLKNDNPNLHMLMPH